MNWAHNDCCVGHMCTVAQSDTPIQRDKPIRRVVTKDSESCFIVKVHVCTFISFTVVDSYVQPWSDIVHNCNCIIVFTFHFFYCVCVCVLCIVFVCVYWVCTLYMDMDLPNCVTNYMCLSCLCTHMCKVCKAASLFKHQNVAVTMNKRKIFLLVPLQF